MPKSNNSSDSLFDARPRTAELLAYFGEESLLTEQDTVGCAAARLGMDLIVERGRWSEELLQAAMRESLLNYVHYYPERMLRAGFAEQVDGGVHLDLDAFGRWFEATFTPERRDDSPRCRRLAVLADVVLRTPPRTEWIRAERRAVELHQGWARKARGRGSAFRAWEDIDELFRSDVEYSDLRATRDGSLTFSPRQIRDKYRRNEHLVAADASLSDRPQEDRGESLAALQAIAAALPEEAAEAAEVEERLRAACQTHLESAPEPRSDAHALRAVRRRLFDLLMSELRGRQYERHVTQSQVAREAEVSRSAVCNAYKAEKAAVGRILGAA